LKYFSLRAMSKMSPRKKIQQISNLRSAKSVHSTKLVKKDIKFNIASNTSLVHTNLSFKVQSMWGQMGRCCGILLTGRAPTPPCKQCRMISREIFRVWSEITFLADMRLLLNKSMPHKVVPTSTSNYESPHRLTNK
jgi:hypothetical protein